MSSAELTAKDAGDVNNMREYVGGPPRKKELRDKVNQIGEKPCICELIDNCIDYWTVTGRQRSLKVDIKIKRDKTAKKTVYPISGILVKWNMPIPRDRLDALVTPGSAEDEREGIIGLWGQGAKLAMHGIARSWTITTYWQGKRYRITCPEDWIHNETEWRLPLDVDDCESTAEGETVFESELLHEDKWKETKRDDEFHELEPVDLDSELRTHLSAKYSQFGRARPKLSLSLNDDDIELIDALSPEILRRDFLWIPGYEPHYNMFELDTNRNNEKPRTLKIKIFVGLHVRSLKEEAGVYLYGNNRLFLSAFKGPPLYKSYAPKDTRIRVHVFLDGYSRDIMWGWPEKDGLNEDHSEIDSLAGMIKTSVEPYNTLVTLTTEHLELYSLEEDATELVNKAGLQGIDATAVRLVLDKVREQNTPRLRLFMTTGGEEVPSLKGLGKAFKKDVNKWITETKEETRSLVDFHLALAEGAILDDPFKKEVGKMKIRFAKESRFSTGGDAKEEPQRPMKGVKTKGKTEKEIRQTTLDSFYPALDRLGEIMGEGDRNKVLLKVSKALDKIVRELDGEGYATKKKQIYKDLLGLK